MANSILSAPQVVQDDPLIHSRIDTMKGFAAATPLLATFSLFLMALPKRFSLHFSFSAEALPTAPVPL